jgi:hypothetical protein
VSRLFQQIAVAAVVTFAAATPAHAADFLKAIEDVPLPAGMAEQGEPLVFESEQGRVVRTSAEGQVGAAEISSFYAQSLPALGWKPSADGASYERENERLTIAIREPASVRPVRITFELVVKVASTKLAE